MRGAGWVAISEAPRSSGEHEVWTPDGWRGYFGPEVTKPGAELFAIETGVSLVVATADHPLMSAAGAWVRVDELRAGSSLSTRAGVVRVLAIEPAGRGDAWDIRVPDTGCFHLRGGLVAKNCDTVRYGVFSDAELHRHDQDDTSVRMGSAGSQTAGL